MLFDKFKRRLIIKEGEGGRKEEKRLVQKWDEEQCKILIEANYDKSAHSI